MNDSPTTPDSAHWTLPILSALSGLLGVVVGVFLTSWHAASSDRTQRRLGFIEQQLSEFWSPMLGLRAEVRMFSELRDKLQSEASDLWSELVDSAGPGAAGAELTRQRWPQFQALIEFDNKRLAKAWCQPTGRWSPYFARRCGSPR